MGAKTEIRADADVPGPAEGWRVKCQREAVLKIRMDKADAADAAAGGGGAGSVMRTSMGGGGGKRRAGEGDVEDELRRK